MTNLAQELQLVINSINSISPMGVLLIGVLGYIVLPRLKFLQRFLVGIGIVKKQDNCDLAPILMRLTNGIEKISGNDLSHIKADIEKMQSNLGSKMDEIDKRFIVHDAQAKAILNRTNDIWDKLENMKMR